ncbi:hypothetical protein JI721_12135 [Alicyclobacillus cycloheptanicus]|uniref:Uncharacterized protein n=1 Tax=Alicyclobacillus cycloheptanicus TaxID=1457 RepID=A0ABT9XLR8_9BACL|nr:hypothetical protein [Alicyclobacillus cycloheptanicus]MDQ0191257.1 hypothetical protein [Alicyclobacillus cycloheptanicus]WDM00465.1 hypothetical protein JI721_12135 [Alicyclobacillus cycloheptanicus]
MPLYRDGKLFIENYFMDFWGPILGIGTSSLFVTVSSAAKGGHFATLSTQYLLAVLRCSDKELFSWIKTLEHYGFIRHFFVENTSRPNEEPSNRFVVRKSMPLLTQELVNTLPPLVKKRHDDFLKLNTSQNARHGELWDDKGTL